MAMKLSDGDFDYAEEFLREARFTSPYIDQMKIDRGRAVLKLAIDHLKQAQKQNPEPAGHGI